MRYGIVLLFGLLMVTACKEGEQLSPLPVGQFAPQPDTVTVKIVGYKPQTNKIFQNLFISNNSVRVSQGSLFYSTTRDGFWDEMKQTLTGTFSIDLTGTETAVTGFSDLLIFFAGINVSQQPLMFCSTSLMANSSFDGFVYDDTARGGSNQTFLGLRDCDKLYVGLDKNKFDYNEDGIPDYVEMLCGMSALNRGVAKVSTAADGVTDLDKCKRHIPIDENFFTQPNQIYAYHYDFQLNSDGTTDFTVSNIPIMNGGKDNFIAMTITETDSGSGSPAIYTAFSILKDNYKNRVLTVNYWPTAGVANTYTNQEIIAP